MSASGSIRRQLGLEIPSAKRVIDQYSALKATAAQLQQLTKAQLEKHVTDLQKVIKRLEARQTVMNGYKQQWMELYQRLDTDDARAKEDAEFDKHTATDGSLDILVTLQQAIEDASEQLDDAQRLYHPPVEPEYMRPQKIKIPKFSGGADKYLIFWDIFSIMIDQTAMTTLEKVTHLTAALDGTAKDAVKHIRPHAANYELIKSTLKEKFGNEDDRMRQLHAILTRPVHAKTAEEVRTAFDRFRAAVFELTAMNRTPDVYLTQTLLRNMLPEWARTQLFLYRNITANMALDDLFPAVHAILKTAVENSKTLEPAKTAAQKGAKKENTDTVAAVTQSQSPQAANKTPIGICVFCDKKHNSAQCRTVTTYAARQQVAKDKKLCFKCLKSDHLYSECRKKITCARCSHSHNTAFCKQDAVVAAVTPLPMPRMQPPENIVSATAAPVQSNAVLLNTRKAPVYGSEGMHNMLIFFDDGSTSTFIRNEDAKILQLRPYDTCKLTTGVFGKDKATLQRECPMYKVAIRAQNNDVLCITALGIDHITPPLATLTKNPEELINAMGTEVLQVEGQVPQILIGSDQRAQFFCGRSYRFRENLTVQDTRIGPVIHGPTTAEFVGAATAVNLTATVAPSLGTWIEDVTALDAIGIPDSPLANEQQMAKEHFTETAKVLDLEDARIQVSLPFVDRENVPPNFHNCQKRLEQLYRKLERDNSLQACQAIIDEQLRAKIIEEVPAAELLKEGRHYLPIRIVSTPTKTTTKVRMTLDASTRAGNGAKSLNDCLLSGKPVFAKLTDILLDSRCHPIVVTSDLEKAFLQLELDPDDRDFVRFLWPRDLTSPPTGDNIVHYRFLRLPFGVSSSPMLLLYSLDLLMEKMGEADPAIRPYTDELRRKIYVDNCLQGSDNAEQAILKAEAARTLFARVHMNLREFASNSSIVNDHFGTSIECMKLLGITWNLLNDTYLIGWRNRELPPATKRSLVSLQHEVFDPLGLICPAVLPIVLQAQQLWKKGYDWDKNVDAVIYNEIATLVAEREGQSISVSRYPFVTCDGSTYDLHVFCDASGKAYGAAAYIVQTTPQGKRSALVFAKSRAVPLTPQLTICRLELVATALAGQITRYLITALPFPIRRQFIWTDSTTVLHWIRSGEDSNRFVNNRIRKLEEVAASIRYVPTAINPADVASRGCSPRELRDHPLWWNGPAFLCSDDEESDWPSNPASSTNAIGVYAQVQPPLSTPDAPQQPFIPITASSWMTLMMHIVVLIKFIYHCSETARRYLPKSNDKAEWFQAAENFALRQAQSQTPLSTAEYKTLDVFVDEDGIQRRRTRIKSTDGHWHEPILLQWTREVELLILHLHNILCHAGVNAVVNAFRARFTMRKLRSAVQSVIRQQCLICRRYRAKPFALPPMPLLPTERVTMAPPFAHTGLDYCGPFTIRLADGPQKAWVSLWTCLVTRAVHLEMVFDASTEQFLLAYRRFVSRRGRPLSVLSDNASIFKTGRDVILKTQTALALDKTRWRFITERAPWHGGVYERIIGVVKKALKHAIGRRILHATEFQTVLTETEFVVNCRPLVQANDDDDQVLRPIDFLLPDGIAEAPVVRPFDDAEDPDYVPTVSTSDGLLRRWQRLQTVIDKFRVLWQQQYLTTLRDRIDHHAKDGAAHFRRPEVGEVVIIESEDNSPKENWKLGKIDALQPSSDGEVRTVIVKTANHTTLRRSVKHVYPLEVRNEDCGRKRNVHLTPAKTIIAAMILAMTISLTHGAECGEKAEKLPCYHAPNCMNSGYGIFLGQELCWKLLTCPKDKHWQMGLGCTKPCECPEWSHGCSFVEGSATKNSTTRNVEVLRMLRESEVTDCSFQPDPTCAEEPSEGSFHMIQLFDGSKHLVRELHLEHREVHEDSIICKGTGEVDGPPEYCAHHDCHSGNHTSPRICVPFPHELVLWKTRNVGVAVKAWGLVKKIFHKRLETLPTKVYLIKCRDGTVSVEGAEIHDRIEITMRKWTFLIQAKEIAEFKLPRPFQASDERADVRITRHGNVVHREQVNCSAIDWCEQITCYWCAELLANYKCTTWATFAIAATMVGIILGLLSFLCYRRTTRKRLEVTLHDVRKKDDDYSAEEGKSQWRYERRRPDTYKMLPLLLAVLLQPLLVSTCSVTDTFTAEAHECTINVGGFKKCTISKSLSVTLTELDEACITIQDDMAKPLMNIQIAATVVRRCQTNTLMFTRPVSINVVSNKRCASAGSCTGSTCADVLPTTRLNEFAAYQDFPGFTGCLESCGCWGCGCFLCSSACLFYRVIAKPIHPTVEIYDCPVWIERTIVTVSMITAHGTNAEEFELENGQNIELGRAKFKVVRITPTMEVDPTKLVFITDGEKTATISEQGIAASKVFECPSREHSDSGNCTLNTAACFCQSGGEAVHCACRDNQLLTHELQTHSLPISLSTLTLRNNKAEVFYTIPATVDLSIELAQMQAAVQVDSNSCSVEDAVVKGCANCVAGAKTTISCQTNFGKTLAYFECPDDVRFSVVCSAAGSNSEVRLAIPRTTVNYRCNVTCPASKTTMVIRGDLMYVVKDPVTSDTLEPVLDSRGDHAASFVQTALSFLQKINETSRTLTLIFCSIVFVIVLVIRKL